MKKILITGAHGFIAKHISRAIKGAGCYVIGTSRSPEPLDNFDEVLYGELGKPLAGVYDRHGIDALIHCAFDKGATDNISNAEGTRIWAEEAEKNNVEMQIFMSSISADEDAIASYGKRKYETEEWFLSHNHIVFRLGLVVGNGGLFESIVSSVKKSPVIPLIDRGRTLTYLTEVDQLGEIVSDTVLRKNRIEGSRIWYLQQAEPYRFVDILKAVRKHLKCRCLLVPVPYGLILWVVGFLERLNLFTLGLNTNNIKGLRQLEGKTFRSDLKDLGYPEAPLEALIRKIRL